VNEIVESKANCLTRPEPDQSPNRERTFAAALPAGLRPKWIAAVHVEVQVFRVLIAPKIREDATGSMLGLDPRCDGADNPENSREELIRGFAKVRQGRHVTLRDHDDVDGPEWFRVMEGEDLFSLHHYLD
jgi:hypothetical protein